MSPSERHTIWLWSQLLRERLPAVEERWRKLVVGAVVRTGRRIVRTGGGVPSKSAAVLLDHIKSADTERIHLQGGHVGAVVSRKGATHLWPRLHAWWRAHPAAPANAA